MSSSSFVYMRSTKIERKTRIKSARPSLFINFILGESNFHIFWCTVKIFYLYDAPFSLAFVLSARIMNTWSLVCVKISLGWRRCKKRVLVFLWTVNRRRIDPFTRKQKKKKNCYLSPFNCTVAFTPFLCLENRCIKFYPHFHSPILIPLHFHKLLSPFSSPFFLSRKSGWGNI